MERTKSDVLVEIGIYVAGTVFAVVLTKWLMRQDFQLWRMRGYLAMKHYAETQEEFWRTVAAKAATEYQKARV